MNIIKKYIPIYTLRRSGQKLSAIKFIVAHDTGNLDSTALQNVDYFIRSADEIEASAHVFVDDINIIECIPQDEKAWHVRKNLPTDNLLFGGNANDNSLGIELCYFTDLERSKLAYKQYVEYIKSLCQKYNLNPAQAIIGHFTLDPTRRTDPINAFYRIGKKWIDFLEDLKEKKQPGKKTDFFTILDTFWSNIISYFRGR